MREEMQELLYMILDHCIKNKATRQEFCQVARVLQEIYDENALLDVDIVEAPGVVH